MSDKKKLIKAVIIGLLCGILTSIILMCILSAVMLSVGLMPEDITNYIMIGISAIGAAAGGFIASKLNKGAGLIVGLITGFAMFLILTITSLIKSDGAVSVLTGIRLLAMLLGGAVGGVLGLRERRKISI